MIQQIKMNKRAVLSNTLISTVVGIIAIATVVAGISIFLVSQKNAAAVWEDYYAKEISRVINLALPGDEISLDVTKAFGIATKSQVRSQSEIFTFDNPNNEVCVKLAPSRKTCYPFFNDVDVINYEILPVGDIKDGKPVSLLKFKVAERPVLETI